MNIDAICKDMPPEMRPEVETLAKSVDSLRKKIEEQRPVYDSLPLAQLLTTTQGEKALKANPALAEFRATVRDYAASLDHLLKMLERRQDLSNQSKVVDLRKKYGVKLNTTRELKEESSYWPKKA